MDEQDKLENIRPVTDQTLLSNKRARLQEIVTMAHDTLAEIGEQDVATVPERNFVAVFLPIFAGEPPTPYKAKLFPHWVNIAGNPYRPVDVVDTKGKVLFRVPPLFDRMAIGPSTQMKRGQHSSISHVVASAGQFAAMSPAMGEQYLSKELTKRALLMKVPQSVLQDLETWNAIFARYGRPPLVALPPDVAKKDPTNPESPKDSTGGVEIEFE